jgi:hypothetical protein
MSAPAHFVIVGGGTAGWIAAFIFQDSARRAKLDARISVVESSKIPTVGVGEASTAAFRVFLQRFGISEFEFFRETGATFKLGIRHQDWRRRGYTYYGPIDDPHQVVAPPPGAPSDYLNVYCVAAGRKVQDMHLFGPLLERKKAPYAKRADGSLIPLGPFHHAFHFDQALVGKFLKARSAGIGIVDAVVSGVERDGETGDIRALVLDGGEKLAGDFFVDATGFRKQLIVKELNAPWISYARELPVNRALPFWIDIKPGEEIANYTLAWAQEAGWMWQIPTQTRYGCGYVYSDEFRTPEEAKLEVERALGREIDARGDIRFQIGRLEKAWMGNCLAVGLSSSFLEPLESTSIHGTIVQMMLFADRYLKHPADMTAADRDDYNARVGRQVDDFRTFVNTHYVVERDDTPFWRNVRAERLHKETRERLARWQTEMPRREHFADFLFGLPHVETQLHYPVLDGLGLLDPNLAKAEMARQPEVRAFARKTVDGLVKEYKLAASKALGHAEFLEHVRNNAG